MITRLHMGFLLLAGTLTFSCQNSPSGPEGAVVLEKHTLEKSEGKDCDKPDTLRFDCAVIDLSWPSVKEGNAALQKSVTAWTDDYLISILAPMAEEGSVPKSIDAAAKAFFAAHQEMAKEAPDSPMSSFIAESVDTVLLNDGRHLTLKIDGETYMGGAHGSPTAAIATFDVKTGKKLSWDDLITDKVAVQKLAEKKFRSERLDIFQPGEDGSPAFNFDDTFQFKLPENYGLTAEGIYFSYLHYEVTPYALGRTDFVLTFEELGALMKKVQ